MNVKRGKKQPIRHYNNTALKIGPKIWQQLANRMDELWAAQQDEDLDTWDALSGT